MPLPDPHIVTAGDGTRFRCRVDGSDWKFTEVSTGKTHVGPAYRPLVSADELRAIVIQWWAIEKALRRSSQ